MTERTWRTADPLALLGYLFPPRSPDSTEPQSRKSRLYLLACARRAWDGLPWVCRALVEVAERVAHGEEVDPYLVSAARAAAEELTGCRGDPAAVARIEESLTDAGATRPVGAARPGLDPGTWTGLAHLVYYPLGASEPDYLRVPAGFHSADLVREVFGNPFRPVRFDPRWRTGTVVHLARGMYATADFSPMPMLADALQDAGCAEPAVLEHCRTGRGHVRGCWVLEALLHPGNDRPRSRHP